MKVFYSFLIALLLIMACQSKGKELEEHNIPAELTIASLDTFAVLSSIRALEVVDDQTVWFAGSEGVYGYTKDGGQQWFTDSLRQDTLLPHFRAIAVTGEAVHLLSIASPALLFRSPDQGQSWKLVYREDHPAAFYDAMTFWDDQNGIAIGDPTDGCPSIILTRDGGKNWQKIGCDLLPPAYEGEASFAASNSNVSVYGDHAWIVTGGAKARVFHTPDRGKSWEVFQTPIREGGQMTGIFTVDFLDENTGIIFGGDWNDKENRENNKAITMDGGRTWQLAANGATPGYRSCVQYAPGTAGKLILAAGIPGISYTSDGGQNWQDLSTDSFYTFRFGPDWKQVWLAGNGKIGRLRLQ